MYLSDPASFFLTPKLIIVLLSRSRIYKCLDQLDTLLIQDLSLVSQWKQDEENDEKKNSVQVLSCVFRLLDTNEQLKNNSGLLFILKCVFQKHKRLFENLNYEQEPFESADDLPVEAYSLRKYWRQIYPQLRSRVLVENLMQNDLSDLSKQFRFSEILEFFLLVERTNFWQFYQQIRKERLMTLSGSCADLKALVEQLVQTIDYEICLVTNFRYVQNVVVEFSDYLLPYSNLIKAAAVKQLDSIGSQSNAAKVATLLSAISELNRLEELVKSKAKLWAKLDLPNSVSLKKLQWDYKEHLIKKDYFNFLLNELNKELNAVTSGDEADSCSTDVVGNSKLLSSFVRIVQVLDRYSLIYVKQMKKAFTVIIEVNINQFIQAKFGRLLKRAELKQLYLYLNTLYYVKENFANYGIDSNKVNELISAQECEFKAKHLFVLGLNAGYMEYYVCYLSTVRISLLNSVNFNLFQAQKLYQDLLQEALLQLEERELSNDDLVLFLSNLPDLLVFAYDNEALFLLDSSASSSHRSPFQKIVNKCCWKLLFRVGLLNAPIKCLHNELSKIDDKLLELYDGKQCWLQYFNPTLYSNLPYYHALVCNQKSVRHFIFVCRPFVEFRFRFTNDLLKQLVKSESFSKPSKEYRKNRNRLLKAIFNLATTSSTQLGSLSSAILPLIQGQTLNFDSIQFELLLDDALYKKHSTNLNQLDWIFGLVKLVKTLVSTQLEIVLNSFLYKHTDLISIIELDPSIQNLFAKLNLKFLISESYLLDELTESILELICDSVLLLPNGLLYSLETIAKDLKSNDGLIFSSLTAHVSVKHLVFMIDGEL